MIRTIHYYIWRELLKVTFLALVAFTLVLTVIGVIEPLHKQQGLASGQVLGIIVSLLPVMLSLTLPVGAMFAATVVYGRFAQDNEHLACRASGISTFNLLRPAMILGLVVTACSLLLSNFVAPQMWANKKAIEENVREMAFRQLNTRSYVSIGNSRIAHADSVDATQNLLRGVVAVEIKPALTADGQPAKADELVIVVAQSAKVVLNQVEDDVYLHALGANPTVLRTDAEMQASLASQEVLFPFPNPLKERAVAMDWNRMMSFMVRPYENVAIKNRLCQLRQDILHNHLAEQVVDVVNAGRAYDNLIREQALPGMQTVREQYVLSAASAKLAVESSSRQDRFVAQLRGTSAKPVRVEVFQNGKLMQVYTSLVGSLEASNSVISGESQATLTLEGPVTRTSPGDPHPEHRGTFQVGQLPLPADIREASKDLTEERLYNAGCAFGKDPDYASHLTADSVTRSPQIARAICKVATEQAAKFLKEIKAEIHCRSAFSLSCLLLVSLGAALGLMSRGGEFITAFAVGALPGIAVMIMIFSGRNMIENSRVAIGAWGMSMIWGAIALLLAGTVLVYARLIRR